MKKLLFVISILFLLSFSVIADEDDSKRMVTATGVNVGDTDLEKEESPQPVLINEPAVATQPAIRLNAEELKKLENFRELKEDEAEKIAGLREKDQARVRTLSKEGIGKIKELRKDKLERVASLKTREANKITSLRKGQIERLTEVKTERLRKMAKNLDEAKLGKIASLDQRQIEKLSSLDRERLKEYSSLDKAELKKKLEKVTVRKVNADLAFKQRIIAKEKIELAKKRYKEAEETYLEVKMEFKNEKKLLLEAKEKEDEQATSGHLKKYLTNAADSVIHHLEKIAERTNENEGIDETNAQKILERIDVKTKELEDVKAKVEAATTVEEAKEAGKLIANSWKKIKIEIKEHDTKLVRAKVGEIIKRSEHLEKKLEKVLADMEEEGINVDGIEAKVDTFNKKIHEARQKFKESQVMFNKAKASTDEKSELNLVKEARLLAKGAHESLKEANELLKEIVKDIREAGGNADEVEEETEEEIEIVEVAEETEEGGKIEKDDDEIEETSTVAGGVANE